MIKQPLLLHQSLKQQTNYHTLFSLHRPYFHGGGGATSKMGTSSTFALLWPAHSEKTKRKLKRFVLPLRRAQASPISSAIAKDIDDDHVIDDTKEKKNIGGMVKVKAVVMVKLTKAGFFSSLTLDRKIDYLTDLLGKSVLLELVSSHLLDS
ncbi:hypothetical protein PIB30_093352, partial [Stylosanthes scabra]|nr:hypothetical protein [Stylosanthes scabra]